MELEQELLAEVRTFHWNWPHQLKNLLKNNPHCLFLIDGHSTGTSYYRFLSETYDNVALIPIVRSLPKESRDFYLDNQHDEFRRRIDQWFDSPRFREQVAKYRILALHHCELGVQLGKLPWKSPKNCRYLCHKLIPLLDKYQEGGSLKVGWWGI